jgi:diguanylate cyclase (GGDEF)-like protein/PAS domain S-box-containing protein
MRDDDGRAIHLISQIESLEARRRAEETLAEERERLKITLESIHDAVITTDAETRISYVNSAAESLLGLSAEAARLRRVNEVIHLIDPQTSKAVPSLIAQCVLHRTVSRREQICQLHRSDGSICYVTDVVSPILDSAGTLSGLVLVFHDATAEAERALDLQHRATHDPLTGLINRAEFEKRMHEAYAKARHLGRPSAVLAIDLDRFKAVNDTAGHAAGDALLCKVADACRLAVRSSDTVARLGGDEFAIILDNCAQERVCSIARQILQSLNPLSIGWEGATYSIGASIGVAMTSLDLSGERAWLKAADEACYLAKRDGRGILKIAEAERA